MRYTLALFLLTSSVPLSAQKPVWAEPPRLVVGIVVDQMRTDLIYRYWNNFGEGGFRRLVNEGSFLRDAQYDYAPTETGPGHASIYTGTTPATHGITANDMFLGSDHEHRYCVADTSVSGLGITGVLGKRSPRNLLATTLADELERRTGRRSKTIGIALKDRGAILPIGRTGDAAYWFGAGAEGSFVSSSWYGTELPSWLESFNAERLAASYLSSTWDLLLPRERYHEVLPDDNPYETAIEGAASPTLPLDVQALFKAAGSTDLIRYTPWGNSLTTDLALAAIAAEGMGADAITDLLAISYSSPDELGHEMGPRSIEIEDMYLRLDQELARLFNDLDGRVGKGRYTVFLTSDHGVQDVPAYLRDLKGSAGYVDPPVMKRQLNDALVARFGSGKWVRLIRREQVYLNDSLILARKLDPAEVQRAAADHLLLDPNVAEALTAADLVRFSHTEGVRRSMQRGFMFQRSGDVVLVYRPGFVESYVGGGPYGTTHMTPWTYDTHVPVLFFGQGIRQGSVLRRTSITDIAPTIAVIVGMAMPDGCSGTVVTEALVR